MIRPTTKEIATLLNSVLPSDQIAVIMDSLLSCDCNNSLTDREAELGMALFERLCEINPEAVKIAQSH